jgi:hypothetical protein
MATAYRLEANFGAVFFFGLCIIGVIDCGVPMTPADKRVMELLDRWLTSVELHLKYADLDDVSYHQMQPWPKHERPARWILELAQQKVLSLQSLCKTHRSDNDPSFAESLELMCFLANLVGAQHIQRFIPLAIADREAKPDTGLHRALQTGSMAARTPAAAASPGPAGAPPVTKPQPNAPASQVRPPNATPPTSISTPMPAPIKSTASPVLPAQVVSAQIPRAASTPVVSTPAPMAIPKPPEAGEHTREMPRLRPSRQRQPTANKVAEPRRLHIKAAPAAAKAMPASHENLDDVVVADAVRLLKWGRQWHEIAELIARMAERPGIAEVRKILRSQKTSIEQQLEA